MHLHCLHRDESEEGVEVQRAHDGGLSRAGRVDPCRAVLRVPRDVFRHQLVRLPCQPHPLRHLFRSGHHVGASGVGRYCQVLQQQGGRRPLQLRERVVPTVGESCRQRLFGEHPHDILLEAEDAQGMDKHHQPVPWDDCVGNARFGQVFRCHRPVHPAARSQGLRHDGL